MLTTKSSSPLTPKQEQSLAILHKRVAYHLGMAGTRDKAVKPLLDQALATGVYDGVLVPSIKVDDFTRPLKRKSRDGTQRYHTRSFVIGQDDMPLPLSGALLHREIAGASKPVGDAFLSATSERQNTPLRLNFWTQFFPNRGVKTRDISQGLTGAQQLPNLLASVQRLNEVAIDDKRRDLKPVNVIDPVTKQPKMVTVSQTNPETGSVTTVQKPVRVWVRDLTNDGQKAFNVLRQLNQDIIKPGKIQDNDYMAAITQAGKNMAAVIPDFYKRGKHLVLNPEAKFYGKQVSFFTRLYLDGKKPGFKTGVNTSADPWMEIPVRGYFKKGEVQKTALDTNKNKNTLSPGVGGTYAIVPPQQTEPIGTVPQNLKRAYISPDESVAELWGKLFPPNLIGFQANKVSYGLTEISKLLKHNDNLKNLLNYDTNVYIEDLVASLRRNEISLFYDHNNKPFVKLNTDTLSPDYLIRDFNNESEICQTTSNKQKKAARKFDNPTKIKTMAVIRCSIPYEIEKLHKKGLSHLLPKTLGDGTLDMNDPYTKTLVENLDKESY